MRPTLCHEAVTGGYPQWDAARYRGGLWPDAIARDTGIRCPLRWADRYAIWNHGGSIRLRDQDSYEDRDLVEPQGIEKGKLPDPGDPALQISFAGWDWVFSHRGVFQAALAWKTWNMRWVNGMPNWASWLNGLPGAQGTQVFYPCASPWDGLWAISDGSAIVGLHPQILGPVVRCIDGAAEWALGLVGEQGGRYRGEQLPMGIRRGAFFEPVLAPEGWFFVGMRYENRRL